MHIIALLALVLLAAAVTATRCDQLTKRQCLLAVAADGCVWKQQGTNTRHFQCEVVSSSSLLEEEEDGGKFLPRVPLVEQQQQRPSSPPRRPARGVVRCSKREISHLAQDACFADQRWNLEQDCGCNSVNEATYVLPVHHQQHQHLALNHSQLLNDAVIVFLHVNKAAGTTVKNILMHALAEHQWDGAAFGSLPGWKFMGGSGGSASPLLEYTHHHTESTVYSQCGQRFISHDQASAHVYGSSSSSPSSLQQPQCPLRLVWGNRAMGLCDAHPSKPCVYFTVIREPVARALSDYAYFCLEGAENRHKWTKDMLQRGECTLSPSEWFQQMHTSPYFLVERLTRGCDAQCGPRAAIHNLLHPCTRYLLMEQFDDGLRRLRQDFGPVLASSIDHYFEQPWAVKNSARRSSTTAATTAPVVDAAEIAKLRQLLREDILVYQAAQRNYARQWDRAIESCNAV